MRKKDILVEVVAHFDSIHSFSQLHSLFIYLFIRFSNYFFFKEVETFSIKAIDLTLL